jgi:hypothetical protein
LMFVAFMVFSMDVASARGCVDYYDLSPALIALLVIK